MAGKVFVYRGPGASESCVAHTIEGLRQESPAEVATLDPAELLRGDWAEDALAIVVPGGADLPYCKVLNGAGCALIRRFVEGGGAYLGLCAGAYFASGLCEFERGHPTLEVVGPRELGFFPGVAAGAVLPGFHYSSQAGAAVCWVTLLPEDGGPESAPGPSPGQGEGARGSGDPTLGAAYCNGGPAFVLPGGGAAAAAEAGRVRVLGVYRGDTLRPGEPAAVRCSVGQGVAVLVGPHPEFTANLLERQWGLAPGGPGGGAGEEERAEAARRGRIAAELRGAEEPRRRFWRFMLRAAGIPVVEAGGGEGLLDVL